MWLTIMYLWSSLSVTPQARSVMAAAFGQNESVGSLWRSPPEFQTSPRVLHKHGMWYLRSRQKPRSILRFKDHRQLLVLLLQGRSDLGTSLSLAAGTWRAWLCWDLKCRLQFYRFSVKEHKTELPFFWAAFSCLFQTLDKYREVEK